MRIWYEIEDALETCFEEAERAIHGECRFEVWEWAALESGNEASLVGRFTTRRLAEMVIAGLEDEFEQSGRGIHYPRDDRQRALDDFHLASLNDSTVH